LQQTLHGVDRTALATIIAILGHLGDELVAHPARVRFMAQFDALYARDWSVEQLLAIDRLFNEACRIILLGLQAP